jgi:hypothetical protein
VVVVVVMVVMMMMMVVMMMLLLLLLTTSVAHLKLRDYRRQLHCIDPRVPLLPLAVVHNVVDEIPATP